MTKKSPQLNKQRRTKPTKAQKKATRAAKSKRKTKKATKPTRRTGKVGRPSILTDELIGKVSKLILAGLYVETACASVGFSKSLYYEWLKLGAKRKNILEVMATTDPGPELDEMQIAADHIEPIYQKFSDAIERAVIDAEARDLFRIDAAATTSWQAAAWKLERKYPDRWSRHNKMEHSGKIETPGAKIADIRVNILALMKNPDLLRKAEELVEAMKDG